MNGIKYENQFKKHRKFQLAQIMRQKVNFPPRNLSEVQELQKFAEQLSQEVVNFQSIQSLSWSGVPHCKFVVIPGIRPKIWKYLLRYIPINDAEKILTKKRKQYLDLVSNYWHPQTLSQQQKKVLHTITADVRRIGSEYGMISKFQCIQLLLKRALFVWHNRHPASGYVQGMCDISMPFLLVFLGEYLPYNQKDVKFDPSPEVLPIDTLNAIEADLYWCVSRIIKGVTSNYTQGFDGLRIAYARVEDLMVKIDSDLFEHLRKQKIDLFAVSFRNITTMLLRLFSPNIGVRLFDTFISYEGEFLQLMLFIFVSVVEKFADKLLKLKFEDLMYFLQNLPTKTWNSDDLEMLISQAYCYMAIFSQQS